RPLGNRWTEAIANQDVWVVEYNGEIHGHGFVRVFDQGNQRKAHIFGLYLTPETLGKGLGLKLANLMLDRARTDGAEIVTLESTLTAHKFYQRLGFRDQGPMERHEIAGHLVRCFPMALKLR
ncbi:MAG: GNAT family N-acetyltransferase, partial [Bdellovibrionales bacterium]|nr:GNAT family N-acetyltransferase [Bdellovibrionales bacterium]